MAEPIEGSIRGIVTTQLFKGWAIEVFAARFRDETGLVEHTGSFKIDFDFEVKQSHCDGFPPEDRSKIEIPNVLLELPGNVKLSSYRARVPASFEDRWPVIRVVEKSPKRASDLHK